MVDDVHQSDEEIKKISDQLELLEEQLEDLKHENIITRIHNAKEILEFCDMPIDEKINYYLTYQQQLKKQH